MLQKVRSHYILKFIIKQYLDTKVYLKLVQYNKTLRKNADISIKDYKKIFNNIIIELIPKKF